MFKQIIVVLIILGFLGGLVYVSHLFNEDFIDINFDKNERTSKEYIIVKDFHKIKSNIDMDLFLEQGSETKMIIEANTNFLNEVELQQTSKTLSFEKKQGLHVNLSTTQNETSKPKVTIFFKTLDEIETTNGVKINIKRLETENLNIDYSGDGSIVISNLIASNLKIKNNGNGFLDIKGKVTNLSLLSTGKSYSNLQELEAEEANVIMTNFGNSHVRATKKLFADVAGTGDLVYSGNPTEVITSQPNNPHLKAE